MFQEYDGDALFFRGLGFVAPPHCSLTIIISDCNSCQFWIMSLSHITHVYLSIRLAVYLLVFLSVCLCGCIFSPSVSPQVTDCVTVTQTEQRSERVCGHRKDGGMINRARTVGRETQCEV